MCANEETGLGVVSESMFVDEEIDRFAEGERARPRTHARGQRVDVALSADKNKEGWR